MYWKNIVRIIIACLALVVFAQATYSQDIPQPVGYVNDFANILPAAIRDSINADLTIFEQQTTVEFAVVTVPSLQGYSEESFAVTLGDTWGVGKRGKDNGVVFLLAPNERRAWIQPATGIRNVLTQSVVSRIYQQAIKPKFRQNDWSGGLIAGVHELQLAITHPPAEASEPVPGQNHFTADDLRNIGIGVAILVGIAILGLLISIPVRRLRARREVLVGKEEFAKQLAALRSSAMSADVTTDTRNRVKKLQDTFEPIRLLDRTSPAIRWLDVRETLHALQWDIGGVERRVRQDKQSAKTAREEGPKLMAEIPKKIQDLEAQLQTGERSDEAVKRLAKARTEYERARALHDQQSQGSNILDWVILYSILSNANTHCADADYAHRDANGLVSHYRSSYSSSSSSSSSSFGGFGGGGGFSGGGGAGGGF